MNDLIKNFYIKHNHKYNLTLEEINTICLSPFKLIKETLHNDILKDIRLKYFGIIKVSRNRVKYSLENLEKNCILNEKKDRKKILTEYKNNGYNVK